MTARLLIAGAASGVGKTTLMCGLSRALIKRGLTLSLFKCGPDYLDPLYHARAAAVRSHNLDGWMMGRDAVIDTFELGAHGSEIALIEGVMGLFDGASPTGPEGSSAEIARWLDAPVLLVCDASGMARSLAALVQGFSHFDRELPLAGVVCNRVGSRGHLELLRRAVLDPPIVGALPKRPELTFPERHLGLSSAADAVDERTLDAWGETVEEWFDLDALIAIAKRAAALPARTGRAQPSALATPRCRIGVARDQAFHFYYEYNLNQLRKLGAELVPFSPLQDRALPSDLHGMYLGGGYPELHAAELASNVGMRAAIARFAASGAPVYAECGGLMYLARAIVGTDGARHPMVGLVPGDAIMHARLQALGYVEVETQAPTPLGPAGLRFRGHQFRYSELALDGAIDCAYALRARRRGDAWREGYSQGNLLASYVHAHWASNPLCARGLVDSCAAYARTGSAA